MAAALRIREVRADPFTTPLLHPFATSRGIRTVAEAVRVTVFTDGPTGVGESVPVEYVTGETVESVLAAVAAAAPSLGGATMDGLAAACSLAGAALPRDPSARCGLEMALIAAWSEAAGTSPREMFGGALFAMASDVTIPLLPEAPQLARAAAAAGMSTLKLKVGLGDDVADIAHVRAVAEAVPNVTLRLDANQAFEVDEALRFIEDVASTGRVELFEQPVLASDVEAMDAVARRSPVPVFADESVQALEDGKRIADTAVAGCNLKINKNGICGALSLAEMCHAAGKQLMIGCMLETRYSIAMSLSLACGTGRFHKLDLDSHLLLESDTHGWFDQDGDVMRLHA